MKSSSCRFRVLSSSKAESSFFKTPAASFILVTSANTARVPDFKQRKSQPTLCPYTSEMCPPGSPKVFLWERSVFSGFRGLWLLRRGKIVSWLIHQAQPNSKLTEEPGYYSNESSSRILCGVLLCALLFIWCFSCVSFVFFFFFEPCLLFYRLGSTFLCSWLRIALSCGSYLTRAGMTGVYRCACFMQDWSLSTEHSKCQASPLPTEQHPSLFPVDETGNSIKLNYPAPYILRFLDNLKAWVN